jgi:hypothetical protein
VATEPFAQSSVAQTFLSAVSQAFCLRAETFHAQRKNLDWGNLAEKKEAGGCQFPVARRDVLPPAPTPQSTTNKL